MPKNKKASSAIWAPKLPGGPIDWEAWVAEASQPRGNKGRKRTPEQCAMLSAAQKKRFADKRAQLAAALAAQRAAEAADPKPAPYDPWAFVTVTDRLLGSMQPGEWYATVDMSRVAPAVKYQACKAFAVTWWREGVLSRRQNPAWKPVRVGARQEPKWLYSLTPKGEQRHRVAVTLL